MTTTITPSVRIGDFICLFNEDIHGFIFNDDTSILNNGLRVYSGQDYDKVHQIPNVHAVTFQILAGNRYKLTKTYTKLLKAKNTDPSTLSHAKTAAQAEFKDNESEQARLLGSPIIYGDIVQLRHVLTKKFVQINTREASRFDNNKLMVNLVDCNAKEAQFRVQPRYKVKVEGEEVEVEDLITLESVKSPGNFIHLSIKETSHDRYVSEINCATEPSIFQVYRHYTPDVERDGKVIRGGSAVQLFHKDIEGYVSAEGMYGHGIIVDAHLRYRPVIPTDFRSCFPPKNANTIWQVILEESAIAGDMVKWDTAFHIQHMTSRYYLSFTEEGNAVLLEESGENTLFQFQPLLHDSPSVHVHFERTVRLYHIQTKGWVNSSLDLLFNRNDNGADGSLESIQWDKTKLLQLKVGTKRQYPDAFVLKTVEQNTKMDFNYVGGLFPFLQEILQKAADGYLYEYSGKDIIRINETFEELKTFVAWEDKEIGHSRKNMLRQTKLADLLIQMLKLPVTSKNKFMLDVYRMVYEVFFSIASTRTTSNLLYCGRFLPFFQTQMLLPRNVGVQSCVTVIELIKDNRKVIDRISSSQIITFMNLLLKHKQHQFLDLLGTLCVCNDVAMTENQILISEFLLAENKHQIFQLESGKDEKTAHTRIFISTDNGYNWISIEKFTNKKAAGYSEDKGTFLMKQLELYRKLCHGGNDKCLNLVTQNQGVFKWEVILLALEDHAIPDDLRAQFCSVVTDIYLESGKGTSVLENVTNNFVYRDVEVENAPSKKLPVLGLCFSNIKEKGYIDEEFPGLMDWLQDFLKEHSKLHVKKPDRNLLISQVVRLVSSLVKYGFVYSTNDLQYFKSQIMRYVKEDRHLDTSEQKGASNKGIIQTKLECAGFIDILLSLQFTRKMQHLIVAFKDVVSQKQKKFLCFPTTQKDEMSILLSPTLTSEGIWERKPYEVIVGLLDQLHHKADFFEPEITGVLFEMLSQGNDKIRGKVFHLMNKFYSSNPDFTDHAKRAKLLMNTDSEQVHLEATILMPALRRLSKSKISEQELSSACEMLETFIGFCQLKGRGDAALNMRQDILVNNGILDVLFKLICTDSDQGVQLMQGETSQKMVVITETVTKKSLELLKCLVIKNRNVQDWVYNHLDDFMFNVASGGSSCALMLIELFKGNHEMCDAITGKHMTQIMHLIEKYKEQAPEFLYLLKVFAKHEDSGITNSRHQLAIMKSLMASFSVVGFPLVKPKSERMKILTGDYGKPLQSYYVNLVHLLATCAEGSNAYIESACQKFLSSGEILRVLINKDVSWENKVPFGMFFARVLLDTTKSVLETGTAELCHDDDMWKLIEIWSNLLSNVDESSFSDEEKTNEDIEFMWQIGFHLLQSFLDKYYTPDLEEYAHEQDDLIQLEHCMEHFVSTIVTHVTKAEQINILSNCLLLIRFRLGNEQEPEKKIGCFSLKAPSLLKHKLHEKAHVTKMLDKAMAKLNKPRKRQDSMFYDEELELNDKFNAFCVHLNNHVLGKNTVAYQCNRPELYLTEKDYSPLDVPIPKGLDFQKFVTFFIGSGEDTKSPYKKVDEIIEQLRVSYSLWPRSNIPPEQEAVDLKCLQILRAILYNQIIGLPNKWEVGSSSKKTLDKIKKIQGAYDYYGIVKKVLPLMARTNPQFGQQILQLLDLLLFDANLEIQSSVFRYFKSTKEEAFFFVIRDALEHAAPRIKEMRYIEAKKEAQFIERKKSKVPALLDKVEPPNLALMENITKDMDIILRVISGLCDGQNRQLQNYFRVQPDNLKTINVVAKMTEFISVMYSGISGNTIDLCTRLFVSLHELCEGNKENCITLLNHKIIDYINLLLRKHEFGSCTVDQVMEFRFEVAGLLYTLIEEYSKEDPGGTAQTVCETIALEPIRDIISLCFSITKYEISTDTLIDGCDMDELAQECAKLKFDKNAVEDGSDLEKLEEVGFFYYIILATINDVKTGAADKILTDELDKKAYAYYAKQCMSVELLKDGQVQKKYFRAENPNLLRDEIKEEVKWGIDRSSPSSKLRDLIFYSEDILKDIGYQKKLYKNKLISKLANRWVVWNFACIFLSLVLNILMLYTWEAQFTVGMLPENATSLFANNCLQCPKPKILHMPEEDYYDIIYALGSVHIFCSLMLFACYLLLYHPSMPNFKRIFSREKSSKRESNLEVFFFSGTTVYYLTQILFSVLGTTYYGYFFAFHFFGIIDNNQLLKGVIKSVTLNGKSLLWVGLLGVIILYIYTLIAFGLYRASLNIEEENFCGTLAQCFVTVMRYGTIGDLPSQLHLNQLNDTFVPFVYIALYHVTFFIIFTTILLNIIFGIIVDTFSQIRDTKWEAQKDMNECCLICGKDSHEFEHYAKGFVHHVRKEHNMWSYVFYFIYLHQKDEKDYTALDMHVANLFKEYDAGFFPMNRALSLQMTEETTVEDQVDDVMKSLEEMRKAQHKQDKLLRNIIERIEFNEQGEMPTTTAKEESSNNAAKTNSPVLRPRNLNRQADQWRRNARLAEQNLRFSILTPSSGSMKRMSRNSSTASLVTKDKPEHPTNITPPNEPETSGARGLPDTLDRNKKLNIPNTVDKGKKDLKLEEPTTPPAEEMQFIEEQELENDIIFMHPTIDEEDPADVHISMGESDTVSVKSSSSSREENDTYL